MNRKVYGPSASSRFCMDGSILSPSLYVLVCIVRALVVSGNRPLSHKPQITPVRPSKQCFAFPPRARHRQTKRYHRLSTTAYVNKHYYDSGFRTSMLHNIAVGYSLHEVNLTQS